MPSSYLFLTRPRVQVRCAGNESTLENCRHDDFGVTNCKHDEDVGLACLGGGAQAESEALQEQDAASKKQVDVSKYLPAECGTRERLDEFTPTVQLAKVVSGRGTPRGSYPWQVSGRLPPVQNKNLKEMNENEFLCVSRNLTNACKFLVWK